MRRSDVSSTTRKISSLKTIEGLIDYAILESAELGLPLIVCILRMARLELEKTIRSSLSDRDALEVNLR